MLPLFTVTIFLGAILVFGVQPIAARMILPSFGGSPAVWSATSVFFQVALLVGYGYSFALTRYVAPRRQPMLHAAALVAPVVFLPLSLPLLFGPDDLHPALAVIALLAVGLGVPFTIAATTGPLLQRWFSFTGHRAGRDPYFLYAASNAGSLIVLLAYPFVIEPRLELDAQSSAWSLGYVAFAALTAVCGIVVWRRAPTALDADVDASERDETGLAPRWSTRARWIVLAAAPSALSLGATAYISTDIAAVPLLWIAPLSLYLLSFIVAFSTRIRLKSTAAARLLPWAAAAVVIPSGGLFDLPVWVTIVLHLGFLFVAATMCHTRLAEERPPPRGLTEFYLLVAVGGALGGMFVSLLAPVIFDRVWEYPIAIAAALLLRGDTARLPGRRALIAAGAAVLVLVTLGGLAAQPGSPFPPVAAAIGIGGALLVLLVTISAAKPVLAAAVFVILGVSVWGIGSAVYTDRTFFGVYRVTANASDHLLINGSTVHGLQHTEPSLRGVATTYFHRTGPIGQVFATRGQQLNRVAVVGLGIGTIASYSEPGQEFTFFEIDPAMVEIARNPSLFTFLDTAQGRIEIVVADGRLGLESDATQYDLVILDAFTSDAIPAHLITREALMVYAERLTPDGLIAMNISNRFLDLEPVVGAVAKSLGMTALAQLDATISAREAAEGKSSSTWALLARDPAHLGDFADDPRWRPARVDDGVRPWTDDFSDILAALK